MGGGGSKDEYIVSLELVKLAVQETGETFTSEGGT